MSRPRIAKTKVEQGDDKQRFLAAKVYLSWGAFFQALMSPLMIVKLHVPGQPVVQPRHIGVLLQVDVFVLEATPEPLDEDVVHRTAATIHTDENIGLHQGRSKGGCGELATLGRC